jgi:hypothetical protein
MFRRHSVPITQIGLITLLNMHVAATAFNLVAVMSLSSTWWMGIKHTAEHCANTSKALLGVKHTAERCANKSKALLGILPSAVPTRARRYWA